MFAACTPIRLPIMACGLGIGLLCRRRCSRGYSARPPDDLQGAPAATAAPVSGGVDSPASALPCSTSSRRHRAGPAGHQVDQLKPRPCSKPLLSATNSPANSTYLIQSRRGSAARSSSRPWLSRRPACGLELHELLEHAARARRRRQRAPVPTPAAGAPVNIAYGHVFSYISVCKSVGRVLARGPVRLSEPVRRADCRSRVKTSSQ